MGKFTRRGLLKGSVIGAAAMRLAPQALGIDTAVTRKGRIHQSVSRWCYSKTPLDQLAEDSEKMGVKGAVLLEPGEYEFPRRYGLVCSMGYAGGGDIPKALNR